MLKTPLSLSSRTTTILLVLLCISLFGIYIFIFGNSAQNGAASAAISSSVAEKLQAIFDPHGRIPKSTFSHYVRKVAHFLEFALLGFVLYLFELFRSHRMLSATCFAVLFFSLFSAVMDEYSQSFVDGRGSAVSDVLIDFSGSVFGVLCSFTLILLIRIAVARSRRKQDAKP